MTTDPLHDSLQGFFNQRTLGWADYLDSFQWRGPGYDEGWEKATDTELQELHRLLGAHLGI